MRSGVGRSLAVLTVALGALWWAPAAGAETARPLVTTYAWYWEQQQQQTIRDPQGNDALTVTAGNPWCPGYEGIANPEQTCKPGRLPVEVQGGDYETPDKVAAVAFDLSVAPIGSKVTRFTATFREANDPQSLPVNVEGKRLEACAVNVIFGGGEARRYREVPKHRCSKQDPILAKRKQVKTGGQESPVYEWTFDLTDLAARWVAEGEFATGILIRPHEPKDPGPDDANWRVVLVGPEERGGVTTRLEFVPAKPEPLGDSPSSGGSPSGGAPLGSAGGGGLGSSTTTLSTGTGSAETGLDAGTAASPEVPAPEQAPEQERTLAAERIDEVPGGLPGYVWLGLLAGVAGFTALRSVVLEHAGGMRPNGVLAQIRAINARRRAGAPPPAWERPGLLDALSAATGVAAARIAAFLRRLPLPRRK